MYTYWFLLANSLTLGTAELSVPEDGTVPEGHHLGKRRGLPSEMS